MNLFRPISPECLESLSPLPAPIGLLSPTDGDLLGLVGGAPSIAQSMSSSTIPSESPSSSSSSSSSSLQRTARHEFTPCSLSPEEKELVLDGVAAGLIEERATRPDPNYLINVQNDTIKTWMRDIILAWLVETGDDFGHASDTVALAILMFDRFLSRRAMKRSNLQLLATACLFVAVKMLEVEAARVEDLLVHTGNTYTAAELKRMELLLLSTLGWRVGSATPHSFLRAFSELSGCPETLRVEAFFLLDMVTPRYQFLRFSPSVVAGASLMAACVKAREPSAPAVDLLTRFCPRPELASCAKDVLGLLSTLFPSAVLDPRGLSDLDGLVGLEGQAELPAAAVTAAATPQKNLKRKRDDEEADPETPITNKRAQRTLVSPPNILDF